MLTSLSNGTIFAEIEGNSNKGIVLLHGWGRSRADFSAIAHAAVGSGFVTARFDLPGFGATPSPEVGEDTDWYRDVVALAITDFVNRCEIRELAIVGHSFGGRIAVKLANSLSSGDIVLGADCVGFVVSGVPLFRSGGPSKVPFTLRGLKTLVRLKLIPASRLERYRSNHGSADYRRAEGVMRDTFVKIVNEDYSSQLAGIKGVPFVFYWGKDDTSAPLSHAQRGAEMVQNARLITVDGDHFTFLGEANDVVKELESLFAK